MISKENCYLKSYQKIEKPRSVDLLLKRFQLELISRNYSHVIKCVTIFIIKNNNNLQSYSNHDIEFNCILNMAEYFPNILNKGAHRILFIPDTGCYTPMFSYVLYIPVFVRIPPENKNFYFLYSAMFYAAFTIFFKVLCFSNIIV